MANTKSHALGPGLTNGEKIAGFCYLPVYVLLLAMALQWLDRVLSLHLTDAQINIAYFILNCIFVWIIFHHFLLRSFRSIRFWELVQAVILGIVFYYAFLFLLGWLLSKLQISAPAYNNEAILKMTAESKWPMIVGSVVLVPLVEETLMRGLIFGTVRRKSRLLAYVVSMLVFALIHVWQYAFDHILWDILLAAVPYLPAGIVLGWTYEKAKNIWAPVVLHMLINAITFGVLA